MKRKVPQFGRVAEPSLLILGSTLFAFATYRPPPSLAVLRRSCALAPL